MNVYLLWIDWVSEPDLIAAFASEQLALVAGSSLVGTHPPGCHAPIVAAQVRVQGLEVQTWV